MKKLEPMLKEETEYDMLIGKKIVGTKPSPGDEDESTDLIFDDGTILCISNDSYMSEE